MVDEPSGRDRRRTPRPTTIPGILPLWREAERLLAELPPNTPEWEAMRARVERIQREYRKAAEDQPDQRGRT
jgi:hypothetical protein